MSNARRYGNESVMCALRSGANLVLLASSYSIPGVPSSQPKVWCVTEAFDTDLHANLSFNQLHFLQPETH